MGCPNCGSGESWLFAGDEDEPGLDVEALREEAHKEWEIARLIQPSDEAEQLDLTDRYLKESE